MKIAEHQAFVYIFSFPFSPFPSCNSFIYGIQRKQGEQKYCEVKRGNHMPRFKISDNHLPYHFLIVYKVILLYDKTGYRGPAQRLPSKDIE